MVLWKSQQNDKPLTGSMQKNRDKSLISEKLLLETDPSSFKGWAHRLNQVVCLLVSPWIKSSNLPQKWGCPPLDMILQRQPQCVHSLINTEDGLLQPRSSPNDLVLLPAPPLVEGEEAKRLCLGLSQLKLSPGESFIAWEAGT